MKSIFQKILTAFTFAIFLLLSTSTLADYYSDDAKRNSSHVRHQCSGSADDGQEASGFLKKNSSDPNNLSSSQGSNPSASGRPVSTGSPETSVSSSGTQESGR